jgi:hypothetical protein
MSLISSSRRDPIIRDRSRCRREHHRDPSSTVPSPHTHRRHDLPRVAPPPRLAEPEVAQLHGLAHAQPRCAHERPQRPDAGESPVRSSETGTESGHRSTTSSAPRAAPGSSSPRPPSSRSRAPSGRTRPASGRTSRSPAGRRSRTPCTRTAAPSSRSCGTSAASHTRTCLSRSPAGRSVSLDTVYAPASDVRNSLCTAHRTSLPAAASSPRSPASRATSSPRRSRTRGP